jgi:hypothetical protein
MMGTGEANTVPTPPKNIRDAGKKCVCEVFPLR